MAKANFNVDGTEVTVYFTICDGATKPCHYCKITGLDDPKGAAVGQIARVDSIAADGVALGRRTNLYKQAKERLESLVFSGRPVHIGTECEKKWTAEIHANPDAVVDLT